MKNIILVTILAASLSGCAHMMDRGFESAFDSLDPVGESYRQLTQRYIGQKITSEGFASKDSVELSKFLNKRKLILYSDNGKCRRYILNKQCPYGFEVDKNGVIFEGAYIGKIKENRPVCKLIIDRLEFINEKGKTPEQVKEEERRERARVEAEQRYVDEQNAAYAEENWKQAKKVLGTPAAIPYLIEAAEENHPQALYHLSKAFLEGNGVYRNYRQAEILMGDAARQKYPKAQYEFATMLFRRAINARHQSDIYTFFPAAYAWYSVAEHNGYKAAAAGKREIARIMNQRKYGVEAGVNEILWDESRRLEKEALSKYSIK